MILIFALTIFAITPEQEISTKSYWIGFNDIIHNFNKAINAKPNTAALEIKQTIAKIRSMSTKNVDSLVLKYAEKRISLATEYAEFLDSFNLSDEVSYKVEFPIKEKRKKYQNIQKIYQDLYDKHKDMDTEQEIILAYLKEKYNIDKK